MGKTFVYISRWNEFVGEPGIALLEFNPENGDIKFIKNLEEKLTTGCTAVDKKKSIIYVCNEIKDNPDFVKGGGGLIYAYKINNETGELEQISRVYTCCPCPCYISIDPTGKYLVCAHHSSYNTSTKTVQKEDGSWGVEIVYDDATVVLFEINEDGTLGNIVDVVKHTGLKKGFLLHSHPHSAVWEPQGRFFATCDKGDDHIYMYRIDYENKKLVQMCEPYLDTENSAPRYCVFHPTKPFFYDNHEHGTFFNCFTYNDNGELTKIGTCDSLPEGFVMPKMTGFLPGQKPALQSLTMTPDGRFIYNVINGKDVDGVSVFEVQEDGMLKLIQYERVDGVWARGVGVSPDGKYLLVSCLDTDGAVMTYNIAEDGTISPTGTHLSIPGAGYVTFYEADA